MDFSLHYVSREAMGEVFGRELPAAADVYLLDASYTILAAHTRCEEVPLGTCFFDRIPASKEAKAELHEYLHSFPHAALLLRCTRTSVLFVGTVFAHTGLILAIVASGSVEKTLAYPAALHGILSCLCLSRAAKLRYKAHNEEDFAAACRFCTGTLAPFCYHNTSLNAPILPILVYRAQELARCCGIDLTYDFTGLGSACDLELELFTGVMLAASMLARRMGVERSLRTYAALEGGPVLYLDLRVENEKEPLSELLPLLQRATVRGNVLDVVRLREDPSRVQIRAVLHTTELSAQGVRERHAFLEGRSPLQTTPKTILICPDFPEMELFTP